MDASWTIAAPALFVVLWSTGYVGVLLGLPYAEPFTFLTLRWAILTVLMLAVSLLTRAPWPASPSQAAHIAISGLLIHGFTFIGIFGAVALGLPAAVAALILALQPLLTALAAGPLLGERLTARQWLGMLLGLGGVVLVLEQGFSEAAWPAMALAFLGTLGLTAGTLYQKRHGGAMPWRTGYCIQFAAAGVATAALMISFETMTVRWTGAFMFALGWLVIVLSLGAVSLLYLLIRRGAASKVASLFYLVPALTAVWAWAFFGEALTLGTVAGMAVALVGVALVGTGDKV